MKITKELLKRHGLGLCTEAEKKAVEEWFEQHEYPLMQVSTTKRPRANRERIWSRLAQDRPQLDKRMSLETAKNLVFLNSAMKYAAAACFVLIVFFGGRLSVNTATANEIVDKSPKDMLYIYGGDGAEAYVPGKEYKIEFDGLVKLFNASTLDKKINVGDKVFTLNPFSTYYLSGSLATPVLLNDKVLSDRVLEENLEGDFSILRIDR